MYTKWLYRLGLALLAVSILYIVMKLKPVWSPFVAIFRNALAPFFIAGFITYLLHPIVVRLHNRGIPRPLAILLIYILFFGGIGYGIYIGIPAVILQLRDLSENFPQFLETYREWIRHIDRHTSSWPDGLHDRIEQGFDSFEKSIDLLLVKMVDLLKGLFNYIIFLVLIPFIVFYMLKDFDQIKKTAWYLTPRKWRKPGQRLLRDINESLGNYIRGQLLVCFLIGMIASLVLWMLGMTYPLILGIIIGSTNIIPYFGPIIGAVPAVVLGATLSMKMVMYIIILIGVLQVVEGNILSPLIVGRSLHMHPIVLILALLIGGEIGGVLGLIAAVPILAVLKVTLIHVKSYMEAKH